MELPLVQRLRYGALRGPLQRSESLQVSGPAQANQAFHPFGVGEKLVPDLPSKDNILPSSLVAHRCQCLGEVRLKSGSKTPTYAILSEYFSPKTPQTWVTKPTVTRQIAMLLFVGK